ncbi:MAG: hypothetical protein JZD40_06750, partial [Sulfolobus sp.]|nr:hypothetical protein [Sulfolobus sp.]
RKVQNTTTDGISAPVQLKYITYILAILEGGVLGALWAIPDPIFYSAFFGPFIYGSYVNWGRITFHLLAFLPGDIVFGVIAALISLRIVKAIGQ